MCMPGDNVEMTIELIHPVAMEQGLRFTIANLINLRIILFLEYRKTPETQGFWGILRLDTECTPDTQFISSYNYSMIVATRPDPTVRPPSRIANVRPWLIAIG